MTLAFLTAIKALQHRPALVFGNPRAAVVHLDMQALGIAQRAHQHLALGRGELDRVADQVGQRLEQQLAVTMQRRQLFGHLQG
ncbi:hypothetical protein BHU25_08915 [Pseudomonas vranovensis]|uniref:Uncharacterized protein n=1 Tax=Pseudomonas vranovensis TaxID=321661 RepID=A0A423DU00_9PSED|nr:hypothetical protein BHU25_08915 [Pseudomonas vranovensis]